MEHCLVRVFYESFDYLLRDARETGGLELAESATIAETLVDGDGPASAVRHFERLTGSERTVPARRAGVAASGSRSRVSGAPRTQAAPRGWAGPGFPSSRPSGSFTRLWSS